MSEAGTELPGSIGAPATRALRAAGYVRLEHLNGVPAKTLLLIQGVGPTTVKLLRDALRAGGMTLA